jgi:hypothetical protein
MLKGAFCKVCKTNLRAHKADLIKHTKSNVHKKQIKSLNPVRHGQSTLKSHVVVQVGNREKERDLKLAVYIAMHSAIRSIDHLSELINDINSGNNSFTDLKLHRTKCSSLLKYVIAPSLLTELTLKLKTTPYSLIVDESTDCSINKYLCLCVKYFDSDINQITTTFLGLILVEKVTAAELFTAIKNFLTNLGLSLEKLVGIGTDGANNLCGKHNSLYTLLKAENPRLILIRCICHSLDNAASAAVEEMPAVVDFLCKEIFNWFSCSSLRRIEYRRLFDALNNGKNFHNFVQISSTRWLARYNAINTILQHWDELKLHFGLIVNKEKCYSARVINEIINDNSNYLCLKIISPIVYELNKLNLLFQKNDVDIGAAYDDISNLIFLLASKIMKPVFLNNGIDQIIKSFDNPLAFVKENEADFGIEYVRALQNHKLENANKFNLEFKCFNYIKRLLGELMKRLPDNLDFFKKIKVFSPSFCLSPAARYKFVDLPFLNLISNDNLFKTENEYNCLLDVNWTKLYGEDVVKNSATFWPTVLNHKNAGDSPAFQNIAQFALIILSFPNSNAVVERVFSIMNTVKTKVRNKMKTEMLTAILRIKTHLYSRNLCCRGFSVTPLMLQKFTTSVMYNNKTEEEENSYLDICTVNFTEEDYPCISIV